MAKQEMDTRFKQFGTVAFTAVTKVNDFIGYLEDGKVMGTKCNKCGMVFFPPRSDCYSCLSSDMAWFEVTGEGTLISFSKLEYGPVGFENDLPYTIAIAQFQGFKVFGRISKEIPDEAIKIGMKLTVAPLKMANDKISYVFHKA
ncbi:MAG: Zn-ribbon domain-containing OB-fold protein [Deltaproteobacteria bacterium]|nr:Zn-ribbon domain-containing OB-fold protein [Deltaproteobacteria bacterium]